MDPAGFDMVIFGASGDLAMRKLLPALYRRHRASQLPAGRVIGVSRSAMEVAAYRERVREALADHLGSEFDEAAWQDFAHRLDYLSLDAGDGTRYAPLAHVLAEPAGRVRVFYLATGPDLFVPICQALAAVGLVNEPSRVVLEKPLGHDLESALAINARVGAVFREGQIYRIDHYLGKEPVQNLMALRFGNALFEPLWRRGWVSHVQITVAEKIGVGGRGAFYDSAGAMRDMVQNHLLQLLCILAMEPPTSMEPDAIRDEKLKVLRSLKPMSTGEVMSRTVRGQYRAGAVDGQPVAGYPDEPGIAPDSGTETFVALRAEISNWRWSGIPFYLRTGKRLQEKLAEIVVFFRDMPVNIFPTAAGLAPPNRLVIRLQPAEWMRLYLMAKEPGDELRLRPVHLNLDFAEAFRTRPLEAYERLLMDVIRGRLTLFMRHDELVAAWTWVEPILAVWAQSGERPRPYHAGTWGPAAASGLIGREGFAWHEEL